MNELKVTQKKISKIKPFIDQYNWKERNFPSHKKDWNEFEKIIKTIALNILYVPYNAEKIRHAYKSKHNLKRDGVKWHYVAVKGLSALFRGKISKHDGDLY